MAIQSTFLSPQYGHGSFADLPALINHCLTGAAVDLPVAAQWGDLLQRYDNVVLVLVDAFGWRFFEQFVESSPFLNEFAQRGKVLRWTSQFPSTTTAHITCLNTGLTSGQSALFEWQFYEPTLDAMIEPLTFAWAGDKAETMRQASVNPATIYPTAHYPQQLLAAGVQPIIYQPREFMPTTYSQWMLRGLATRGFATLPEGLTNLSYELAQPAPSPRYFFFYTGNVDAIGHYYGPTSPHFAAEASTTLFALQKALLEPMVRTARNTLLIFTADHGMVETDPRTAIYLNTDPAFAGIERFLRRDRHGKLLSPGGSARDVFLYINEGLVAEAQAFLSERLSDKAVVWTTQSLIEQGYFGPPPLADNFLARVGDLVVLPAAGESVWWYEKDRFEQKFYGHHGGLTAQEMEIPVGLLGL